MAKAGKAAVKARAGKTAAANAPRLGDLIVDRIERLAALTDDPGKLTRLYLGPAHKQATALVAQWMQDAGMTTRLDAVGSVVGHYPGATAASPTLILGSHIDTVRDAGRYDGNLGVLTAIAVVERLHAQGRRLPFALDVVAFGDEEGVRFPGTLGGSRALAGRFSPRLLDETDRDGISRRQALAAFGCDVTKIDAEARDPAGVLGYLELHIEQGPVLEAASCPVGVVTAIAGASRGRVTVTGGGGHAGTVPMALRRDALAASAEMVLAIERIAQRAGDVVATVGVVDVAEAAVNAVPREVAFTIDLRSETDASRRAALAAVQDAIGVIAKARGVSAAIAFTYEAPAAAADPGLVAALSAAVAGAGHEVRLLASGAGHDAMSFRGHFPFAMLFVRCRGGLSHHPDEFSSTADIDVAAHVFADCIEQLAKAVT